MIPHIRLPVPGMATPPRAKFLLFGGSGWIGGYLKDALKEQKENYRVAKARIENREALTRELRKVKPTHVLLAAGVVGKPNVDWCEDHQVETIRGNVIGVMNVVDVCFQHDVHVTYFASACVYNDDGLGETGPSVETEKPPPPKVFKSTDPPNFSRSVYTKTKVVVEELLRSYSNVLTLRIRMAMGEDLANPRNVITKILTYPKVINLPNSMTVLPELVPLSIRLAKKKRCGFVNFTNPGSISHNEVLALYRDYIDPEYTWENFTLEEQSKLLKAPRCNCILDSSELVSEFPQLLSIRESIIKFVLEPAVPHRNEVKEAISRTKKTK